MLDMDFYNYISLSIEDCNFNDRNKNDIAIQDILHFPLYLWINSAVVCIYETIIERNINMVCLDNDLKITEWHPILTPLGWKFPSEIT